MFQMRRISHMFSGCNTRSTSWNVSNATDDGYELHVQQMQQLAKPTSNPVCFGIFHTCLIKSDTSMEVRGRLQDPDLVKFVSEFDDVLRKTLPQRTPPEREGDHQIELEANTQPPKRGLFNSPHESWRARESACPTFYRAV